MDGSLTPLRSLGALSEIVDESRADSWRRQLVAAAGKHCESERHLVARYLRGGSITFASMEHVRDVIGQRFEAPGGSGIRTDGVYFWRSDAADYVEQYGIAVPSEFLSHCAERSWRAPELDDADFLVADHKVSTILGLFDGEA